MGTYIIHFDDKPWEDLDDEQYYRCKEIPWFSTTKTTISRLTPYTEDSAYAHGYTEAESKYREIRDKLEKQAYQRGYETAKHECEDCTKPLDNGKAYQQGLTDAWEAARKIVLPGDVSGIYLADLEEIFDRSSLQDVIKDYSASEALEKIRQYEQEKEEIKVGDEVKNTQTDARFIVTHMWVNNHGEKGVSGFNYECSAFSTALDLVRKTGRHFPEIAEVLAKMKEADNG